ncbi:MAG: RNA polymerase factor sigma-54 [Flavobacteriales bacterium]|nr:RNA polymerase factor sigma-54 [Flavobacteriales bacterium]
MLRQSLNQKLLQKLSPQQIQLMKLLQVPVTSLEERIKEEMEENPALEEGKEEEVIDADDDAEDTDDEFDLTDYISDDETPSYKLSAKNTGPDQEDKSIPISVGKSFQEVLMTQLGMRNLSDDEELLAQHLVGNIDDDGYIRRELESIVDDIAFSLNVTTTFEELERLLFVIQEFDPAGVGARDLQECLLIQIRKKIKLENTVEILTASKILKDSFSEFTKKHYDKISAKLELSNAELKVAVDEILKLNPRPGNSLGETQRVSQHIIPDFLLRNDDGKLILTLNSRNAPELHLSRNYSEMLEGYSLNKGKRSKSEKEAITFVKQKIDSAKWFIDAIKQRQHTLQSTMSAIIEYQKEYFQDGDQTKLRPMILKDIAEIVLLDISTISRVSNSKYIQTPFGTFLLKTFFSESLSTDSGEDVSTKEVKKILLDFIDVEPKNKPLTDEKLTVILKEKGYNIARRTVAKYREQLNIPVARLRKEL